MLISHKNKFIFIKPPKTASTSIEAALRQSCGKNDVVTRISEDKKIPNICKHGPRNYNQYGVLMLKLTQHVLPIEVKAADPKIWKGYFKLTVVRNPWDRQVSSFWQQKKRKLEHCLFLKRRFTGWVNSGCPTRGNDHPWGNEKYYFYDNGVPIEYDFVMRFENIIEDFKKVCCLLDLTYHSLPKMKTNTRLSKKHYSHYYSIATKELVGRKNQKTIKYFGYEF